MTVRPLYLDTPQNSQRNRGRSDDRAPMRGCACTVLALFFLSTLAVQADDRDDKLQALEKRLQTSEEKYRALESKFDMLQEKLSDKPAKPSPQITVGSSGFILQSADTNFVLRFRGLLDFNTRSYFDDGGISGNDGFFLTRLRPIIEGTLWRDFDFRFAPELGGDGATSIRDAYVNYRYRPELQLRLGKAKTPFGLEYLQSDSRTLFIQRSLVSDLAPHRDLGVYLHGLVLDKLLEYQFGVFNGVGDDHNSNNTDFDDEKTLAARLFIHPFARSQTKALHGLGVGVAGTYGKSFGALGLPSEYLTEAEQTFFTYAHGVSANGTQWRWSPQAYYYLGPFGFMAEYALSSHMLRQTTAPVTTLRASPSRPSPSAPVMQLNASLPRPLPQPAMPWHPTPSFCAKARLSMISNTPTESLLARTMNGRATSCARFIARSPTMARRFSSPPGAAQS